MSFVEGAAYSLIAVLPLLLVFLAFVVALGKRPGYRRRRQDPNYPGPERRADGSPAVDCEEQPESKQHETRQQ